MSNKRKAGSMGSLTKRVRAGESEESKLLPMPNWLCEFDGKYVRAIGMGVMPLCINYPTPRPSRAEAIRVLHTALECGVRYFDTADTYCNDGKEIHYGEQLVHDAVSSYESGILKDQVIIATKVSTPIIQTTLTY